MTYRRLRVLLDGLPAESAYVTAVRDSLTPQQRASLTQRARAGHGAWSHTDLLLALLADLMAENTWTLAAVNSKRAPKRPQPIPRPGVDDTRSGPSPEAFAAAARVRAQMPVRELPKPSA